MTVHDPDGLLEAGTDYVVRMAPAINLGGLTINARLVLYPRPKVEPTEVPVTLGRL